MTIPTDPGHGQTAVPVPAIAQEPFQGDMYSLDVEPHRHYILDGVIVQQ